SNCCTPGRTIKSCRDNVPRCVPSWPGCRISKAVPVCWFADHDDLRSARVAPAPVAQAAEVPARYCGHRNAKKLPPLSTAEIWVWAEVHRRPPVRLATGELGCGAWGAEGDLERHRPGPDAGPARDAGGFVVVAVPETAPPPGRGGEAVVRLVGPPGSTPVAPPWRRA